jgi:hypothetical protein
MKSKKVKELILQIEDGIEKELETSTMVAIHQLDYEIKIEC